MRKMFINVNEAKPGMKIAEDVFNTNGAVLIAENTVLDSYMIDTIVNMGLIRIKVYCKDDEMIIVSGTELFRERYNENIDNVKGIIRNIFDGKPLDPRVLKNVTGSIISMINDNREIVDSISELRDSGEYMYSHCLNVALLSMLIGKWMKFDYKKVKTLVYAGLLHDIGKSKVSPAILNKPGALTDEEFEEVKKHTVYGVNICENITGISEDVLKGILMHHEREDGSGYPFGLKSEQIHEFGKIIAVADIFDAMTSNRSYKDRKSPFNVIDSMQKENFGKLDHRVVSVFLRNIASYYLGDFVKLSTNQIGEIIFINPNDIPRPIIRVGNSYIDLSKEREIKIDELI